MSDYVKEMGIDSTNATPTKEAEVNNQEDFVQDSTTEESDSEANKDTVPEVSNGFEKQVDGLEKRLADKDDYINSLREQIKKQDEPSSKEEVSTDTDFWDDPEKTVHDMQLRQDTTDRLLQERAYADTVKDYFGTVTEDKFTTALAIDKDFANEVGKTGNVYKTAYEYFTKKNTEETAKGQSLRDEIRAELLKEMGVDKPKKEGVPNMGNMGGSNSKGNQTNASDDGFASVFGRKY